MPRYSVAISLPVTIRLVGTVTAEAPTAEAGRAAAFAQVRDLGVVDEYWSGSADDPDAVRHFDRLTATSIDEMPEEEED